MVINALVHTDYSQRGAPIRIAFFDDRIEVENPGILLAGMTIEDMKSGVSKIRNPVIARVFRELKLIEAPLRGKLRLLAVFAIRGIFFINPTNKEATVWRLSISRCPMRCEPL